MLHGRPAALVLLYVTVARNEPDAVAGSYGNVVKQTPRNGWYKRYAISCGFKALQ